MTAKLLGYCHTSVIAVHSYPNSQAFYSSLVIEHIVATSEIKAFDRWQQALQQIASQHQGFVRLDSCPSLLCDNNVVKRYIILHFDSPRNLENWINSQDRKRLTKSGRDIFRAYRFQSFTTGLEGWFSRRAAIGEQGSLGPPVWKQILSVVLGLYPLIMLRIKLVPEIIFLSNWPASITTLLATLVTSSLLSLMVMPLVTRMMRFWLYPAYRKSTFKFDLLGFGIVFLSLITMSILFEKI